MGLQWEPGSPTAGLPPSRSLIDVRMAAAAPPPGSATGFSPTEDVPPLQGPPEAALQAAMAVLQEAGASGKREQDWAAQMDALRTVRRAVRHHPAALAPSLHALVLVAAPTIEALRSTLARLAIVVFHARSGGFGVWRGEAGPGP